MTVSPGARLGSYEVSAALGAGGMGEVFRARDTKLNRDVAIKVLPAAFADDPERLARFTREAQTLASLNHPNIAAIYGIEEIPASGGAAVGSRALVMELVEGEDLSAHIARGPIPIAEALPIVRQIAEALEEAHEHGIVHRDLKPANVKVTPGGKVKVLDFGLAKAMEGDAGADSLDISHSPTLTHQSIGGVILGTAAYMSPEQARGRKVDKRADIWSFGVVLFEMLTGHRPFQGETVSDVLAAVLTKTPPWATLPAATPASVRRLLRRCLEKELTHRLDSAVSARLDLIDAASEDGSQEGAPRGGLRGVPIRALWAGLTLTALTTAVVLLIARTWLSPSPAAHRIVQTTIPTAGPSALTVSGFDRDVAITPDGSSIVYVGNKGQSLFARTLESQDPTSLFTGAPRGLFVSPDGQWVGFVDGQQTLRKVAIAGGPAVTIALEDGSSRGAVWLPDDTIVFSTTAAGTGLQQVAAAGGPPRVLTRPDRARGEADHVWPEALPGGRAVLFTILPTTGGLNAAQVAVFDLVTKTQEVVLRGGSHAQYVSSGHLIYASGGALKAAAFDPVTRATGPSAAVFPHVLTTGVTPGGGMNAAAAPDGTLIYLRGAAGAGQLRSLAWVDRQGREEPIAAPPRAYVHPRVSPDGMRVALSTVDQDNDIWVWDVKRLTLTRVTVNPGRDTFPVWSPDGRRLFFTSDRDEAANLYSQSADGTGSVERTTTQRNSENATGITPDGSRLIFTEIAPRTGEDIMQVDLRGNHEASPLVRSLASERNGVVSPDGRWLAYEADDSGAFEIYVRPYPDVGTGKWQVSTHGGRQPVWAADGRELFYASPARALMRVGVERASSWAATTPTVLLAEGKVGMPLGLVGRSYDVSSDGKRFLVLQDASGLDSTPPELVLVQGFDELLRRLVPVK